VDVGVEPVAGFGQALHLQDMPSARVAAVVAVGAAAAEAHLDPARTAGIGLDARIAVLAAVFLHFASGPASRAPDRCWRRRRAGRLKAARKLPGARPARTRG